MSGKPAAAARRTILIAPDSFKGSLTSVQVAQAIADGWRRARPDDEILLCPLADGGEGTLAAIEAAGGWQRRTSTARDPLGRQISAPWLISDDGQRAAVEMAAASGLSLLTSDERDPTRAFSAARMRSPVPTEVARIGSRSSEVRRERPEAAAISTAARCPSSEISHRAVI